MKYNDKNTIYALFAYYVVAYANATCTGHLKIAAGPPVQKGHFRPDGNFKEAAKRNPEPSLMMQHNQSVVKAHRVS